MKRQLSLVLALVMILGSFSSVFAAEMPTTQVEKANFLKEVKVLEGNLEGKLNLEQDLKRRDALVVLSRLFDVEEKARATSAEGLTFTDLTDEFYNGFIAWALEEGYAKGKVEGVTFDPNGPLTTQAFATMTLRALGYEENGSDVFKEAYKIAKDLGILEGVEVEEKDTVTRGDMAAMTFNALGVVVKGGDKTLAETLGITMPEAPAAKELTAKVNDTENLKEVVLELSNAKLVDADKLENVNNYKVVDNQVLKAEIQGNNVVVLLEEALLPNREYKLRVRSIDKAINAEYKFTAKDNTIPTVETVEVLGSSGIKLKTSEPINILENVRGRTFEVDGKNIAMDVEVYGRNVILTPYYSETFSKDAKELTIAGLGDFAGFRSAKEVFEIEVVEDEEAPKVTDLILRGDRKVEVVFDKDVAKNTVKAYYDKNSVGNISYESGRHNVYASNKPGSAKKIDTNRVLYTFDNEFLRKRTDFTIVDVTNHSKVKMERTTMEAREILDNIEPEIFDNAIVARNVAEGTLTMRLYFDKEVSGNFVKDSNDEFVVADHFTLYDREVFTRNVSKDGKVVSAKYYGDREDIIDVKFEGLTEWTKSNEHDYVLEIENFTDQASRRNKMFRDYVEFKFENTSSFVINNIDVNEGRNDTEIRISFNKPVERLIAEDFKNYIFLHSNGAKQDVRDLKGKIVTEKDGYEVVLLLPDFEVEKYTNFRVLDTLKTTGNQRLNAVYTHTFGEVFEGIVTKANNLIDKADKYALNADVVAAQAELVKLKGDDNYKKAGQKEVEKAIVVLEKAIEKAEKELGSDAKRAKKVLEAQLVIAETKYAELEVGSSHRANLAAAIADTKVVLADDKATAVEVNAMIATLEIAIEGTVVNKEALEAALAKADAIDKEDYTAESVEAFEVALAKAIELDEATQEEVDAKVKAVNEAIDLLEEKPADGEKLTATYQVGNFLGATVLRLELSDAAELDNVASITVNETVHTDFTSKDGKITLNFGALVEVETISITMSNNDVVVPTK